MARWFKVRYERVVAHGLQNQTRRRSWKWELGTESKNRTQPQSSISSAQRKLRSQRTRLRNSVFWCRLPQYYLLEQAGALSGINFGSLRRYRRVLTISPLIRRILTATYRDALFHKPKALPMRIKINAGRDHSIEVRSTNRSIAVVLTIGIGKSCSIFFEAKDRLIEW